MYRQCKMNIKSGNKKVILELASACNLECKHCFYRQNEEFRETPFLDKDKAFELIDKFKAWGVNKLVLTGGEPAIHPDFLEIARYAQDNIDKVSLCTNGVIPNKELEQEIIDLDLNNYTVSIDSHIDKVHDEFRGKKGALKKVLDFTKNLQENNKNRSIHITIHLNNVDHIEETIEFCRQFETEIVVSSIYYEKLEVDDKLIREYHNKIQDFKEKYKDDKNIILVGFSNDQYCENDSCPDQKDLFIINRKAQLVSCYWKPQGGKLIKKY